MGAPGNSTADQGPDRTQKDRPSGQAPDKQTWEPPSGLGPLLTSSGQWSQAAAIKTPLTYSDALDMAYEALHRYEQSEAVAQALMAVDVASREQSCAGRLLEALRALGPHPDGYCYCRNLEQIAAGHTGECHEANAAIAEAEGR